MELIGDVGWGLTYDRMLSGDFSVQGGLGAAPILVAAALEHDTLGEDRVVWIPGAVVILNYHFTGVRGFEIGAGAYTHLSRTTRFPIEGSTATVLLVGTACYRHQAPAGGFAYRLGVCFWSNVVTYFPFFVADFGIAF